YVISEQGATLAATLKDSDPNARHYGMIFLRANATPQYVANESARLAKLVSSGSVSAKKLDELVVRQNILLAFNAADGGVAAASKEEL
ncbi:hypothetical protein BGZ83_000095, partial [Gryganskiella cystojenkinii]